MLRLRVDPVACDAFGYCAELLPELIWLDEWGYPVIDDAPVPAHLVDEARAAVRACPRKALFLQQAEGPAVPRSSGPPAAVDGTRPPPGAVRLVSRATGPVRPG